MGNRKKRSIYGSEGEKIPLFSIVGAHNSGKSTLLIKLVDELKKRGYRIGIIKHSRHFELDKPGKDSWRYRELNAGPVVLAGPKQMIFFRSWEAEWEPEDIAQDFKDVDLVITEGYKRGKRPKIEVFREGISEDLVCKPEELLAVVSDNRKDWGIPVFGTEEIIELADFVEKKFLGKDKDIQVIN